MRFLCCVVDFGQVSRPELVSGVTHVPNLAVYLHGGVQTGTFCRCDLEVWHYLISFLTLLEPSVGVILGERVGIG